MPEFLVHLSGDKSITHRAFIFASLAQGTSYIHNVGDGADLASTRRVLRQLGIHIESIGSGSWRVDGRGGVHRFEKPQDSLDCGNSGTTMRLMAGLLSGLSFPVTLDGDESLKNRPMQRLLRVLEPLNRSISTSNTGCSPIMVGGDLHLDDHLQSQSEYKPRANIDSSPIIIETQSSSAQLKSAGFLAGLSHPSAITVKESRQSRDHTERMLSSLWQSAISLSLPAQKRPLPAFEFTSPGDFSSASFWIAINALSPHTAPQIKITNVNLNPTRMGLLRIVKRMGLNVSTYLKEERLGEPVGDLILQPLTQEEILVGVTLDTQEVTDALDELPIVALLAAFAQGQTIVRGAQELKVKESDRLEAMGVALSRLGVTIQTLSDGWVIDGEPNQILNHQLSVDSLGDHRIAMCLLIAQLRSTTGQLEVTDSDCLHISYPEFPAQFAAYRALFFA